MMLFGFALIRYIGPVIIVLLYLVMCASETITACVGGFSRLLSELNNGICAMIEAVVQRVKQFGK
jgi:hypothetical protein